MTELIHLWLRRVPKPLQHITWVFGLLLTSISSFYMLELYTWLTNVPIIGFLLGWFCIGTALLFFPSLALPACVFPLISKKILIRFKVAHSSSTGWPGFEVFSYLSPSNLGDPQGVRLFSLNIIYFYVSFLLATLVPWFATIFLVSASPDRMDAIFPFSDIYNRVFILGFFPFVYLYATARRIRISDYVDEAAQEANEAGSDLLDPPPGSQHLMIGIIFLLLLAVDPFSLLYKLTQGFGGQTAFARFIGLIMPLALLMIAIISTGIGIKRALKSKAAVDGFLFVIVLLLLSTWKEFTEEKTVYRDMHLQEARQELLKSIGK